MLEQPRLLIVEDDHSTRQILSLTFISAGYEVVAVGSGIAALELLAAAPPAGHFQVVLSDITLGDTDGITVLKAARASVGRPEVVLMTGDSTVQTAVEALRAGARDYLLKPCNIQQLLATVARAAEHREQELEREQALQLITASLQRLQSLTPARTPPLESAAAPRQQPRERRQISMGQIQVDLFTRTVTYRDQQLSLTPIEFTLLLSLIEEPGKVHTYGELVQKVYGHETDDRHDRALLKSHIHNLRAKLSPDMIKSSRGVGYMFVPPVT